MSAQRKAPVGGMGAALPWAIQNRNTVKPVEKPRGDLIRGFSGSIGGTSDGRDHTITVRLGMQPKAENNPGVTTRHSSAIFCLIEWRAGRNQPPSCGKPRRQLTASSCQPPVITGARP